MHHYAFNTPAYVHFWQVNAQLSFSKPHISKPAIFFSSDEAVNYLLAVIQGNMIIPGLRARARYGCYHQGKKSTVDTHLTGNQKTHFGTGVQKAKKSNLHIFVCFSHTGLVGMSETEKKKTRVMLVTSAGVSKYENTMLITDALCIWVWEKGRGSVSCSGLFHALDQASPDACTQYMQEGKASFSHPKGS